MVTPLRRPRHTDEVRNALRRAWAIIVVVAALALTSPPAAAPTDLDPAAGSAPMTVDTDPLLGPWPVERFLAPFPNAQDFPAAQHGGTASTPAAVLPAAGLRGLWVVRRVRVAALTLWEFVRHGSAVMRAGLRWLQDARGRADAIYQQPLPVPSRDLEDPPVLAPDGFKDILHYRGTGTLRSGLRRPMADSTKGIHGMTPHPFLRTLTLVPPGAAVAAQTRFARPRDGPHRVAVAADGVRR